MKSEHDFNHVTGVYNLKWRKNYMNQLLICSNGVNDNDVSIYDI